MKKIIALLTVIMLGVLGYGAYGMRSDKPEEAAVTTPEPTPETTPEPTPEPAPEIDFSDTSSLLVVANKAHRLPDGYEPSDLVYPNVRTTSSWQLREPAARALEQMFAGADADGVRLVLGSAYRSAAYQSQLWHGYSAQYGSVRADRISSRPGYSDHQTGLAVDIVQGMGTGLGTDFNESFENTPEAKWLKEHAHEYGWIMRYPKGKEEITGYAYEPWHFRYIGVDYATAVYEADEWMSFEEYFGVEGGTEYKE